MNLTQFLKRYDTEQKCQEYFRLHREQQGICCANCKSTSLRWLQTRLCWTCNKCGYRLGLRKGTVMENSKLDYRLWLSCLYLIVMTKKGYSAIEMQRILGHKRYEPIWLMMHKIRACMGMRDEQYTLDGFVELDEGFYAGHRKKADEFTGTKAKELTRNEKVLVAINSSNGHAKYLKMTVVQSLSKVDVAYEVPKMIDKSATVKTDGRRCYTPLKNLVKHHETLVIKDKKEVCKAFPWVHIAISNSKKKINGLHHHVKNEYMQNYLNEFTYKFNRRYFGIEIFDRLILATLSMSWFALV